MHELAQQYTIVIVTHNMQQAARVSDYTAFFTAEVDDKQRAARPAGRVRRHRARSSPARATSGPRTTSPAASAEPDPVTQSEQARLLLRGGRSTGAGGRT